MADSPQVQVKTRTETGKGAVGRLRAQNQIPCVLYGRGIQSEVLTAGNDDMHTVTHAHGLVELCFEDGSKKPVLVREIQRDHLKDVVLHVDFQLVRLDEKITNSIPLVLFGEAKGEMQGAIVEQIIHDIEIECFPQDMPDEIEVVVSDLDVDDTITVSQIKMPPNVVGIFSDPDAVVVTCVIPRAEEEGEDVDGDAEPEVIGKGKEEDEEGADK